MYYNFVLFWEFFTALNNDRFTSLVETNNIIEETKVVLGKVMQLFIMFSLSKLQLIFT